ncbi:MAG: MFS transporter [Rhodospirillaceae bacterium]|nr:MFS transporter [Rhodospirillaceae bacterium]
MSPDAQTPPPTPPAPLWAPLASREFRTFYGGLFITMVGGWMNGIGCSWLMTSLDNSALMLGLVQASFTLPGIIFSLPAGVLADKTDRRKFILTLSVVMMAISIDLAVLAALGWVRPWSLLLHTLAMGTIFALQSPAMLSVMQDMVPRELLPQALTLNSISLNVGRSIGPVIAGALISSFGVAAAFLVNSFGNAALASVFIRKRPHEMRQHLRESFLEALWNGLRFAATEHRLRRMLIRLGLFLTCASALLALMPMVARVQLGGGPATFGTLVTWVGVGSVVSAFGRGRLATRITPDIHIHISVVIAALAYAGLAFAHTLPEASAAAFFYGLAWTNATITFQVAMQMSLPTSMRGRGASLFIMTFGTGMMLGGVIWGIVADLAGMRVTLLGAGLGTFIFNLLTSRMSLQTVEQTDDA